MVTWKKDGEDLDMTDYDGIKVRLGNETALSRIVLTKISEEHAGNYTCIVALGDGSRAASTSVQAIEVDQYVRIWEESLGEKLGNSVESNARSPELPASFVGEKPYFTENKRATDFLKYLVPGSSQAFNCEAAPKHGHDKITKVKWFKNGVRIINNERPCPDIAAGNAFYLCLHNLQRNDTGLYSCEVSNIFGSVNRTFIVVVSASASEREYPSPSKIVTTKEALPNGLLRLHCEVTIEMPLPLIGDTWWKVDSSELLSVEEQKRCNMNLMNLKMLPLKNSPLFPHIQVVTPMPNATDLWNRKFRSYIDIDPGKMPGVYVCMLISEMSHECVVPPSVNSRKVTKRPRLNKNGRLKTPASPLIIQVTTQTEVSTILTYNERQNEVSGTLVSDPQKVNSTEIAGVHNEPAVVAGIVSIVLIVFFIVILPAICIAYSKHRRRNATDQLVVDNRNVSTSLRRSNVDYIVPVAPPSTLPSCPYSSMSRLKLSTSSVAKLPVVSSMRSSMEDTRVNVEPFLAAHRRRETFDDDSSVYEYFKHPPSMVSSYAYSGYDASRVSQRATD
ncbi:uncharacterized protein LOC129600183 isoform X2 [Paramacrobiotus metropolitanus]|nr:uncharacterized protein LOC129600183 isoform X2 [Paramacrobiotus metropolitanus]XP_055354589.1 uncharacterized protein LOC129600183 isoform X2 [Paramacrobiotus metropolitanus]